MHHRYTSPSSIYIVPPTDSPRRVPFCLPSFLGFPACVFRKYSEMTTFIFLNFKAQHVLEARSEELGTGPSRVATLAFSAAASSAATTLSTSNNNPPLVSKVEPNRENSTAAECFAGAKNIPGGIYVPFLMLSFPLWRM